jgi:hypothetical protein
MQILDQIEEARKEFVAKVKEILPEGYSTEVPMFNVVVNLHNRKKNEKLSMCNDWRFDTHQDAEWTESKENYGKTYLFIGV